MLVAVGVLVGTLLAACDAATTPGSMMGADPSSATVPGLGMMGSTRGGFPMAPLDCDLPSSLPGQVVHVMLVDGRGAGAMGWMMGGSAPTGRRMLLRAVPATVAAGETSFLAVNRGGRTHELVVLPLPAGQRVGERVADARGRVDETGSLGEASASCAGGEGDGIESGRVGWMTLDLPAGRYELVCNLRNHYANGMYQLLVVR
ncbi:hypothetical protein E8D34_20500 [Nocardioides sp. GY 10113]|nr:hypothetical protein E8D34_20500 [Nocardioides sp. GY 10113]